MHPPLRMPVLTIICLIIFAVFPGFARAPLIENTSNLIIVSGNSLSAGSTPLITPMLNVYGAYIDESEMNSVLVNRMKLIIHCESSGKHEEVWGDLDYKYPAYGIAQFQERTFYWMAGLAGIKNPNWKDKEQQIQLLYFALENGLEGHWTCAR